jgi:hypothetical protein
MAYRNDGYLARVDLFKRGWTASIIEHLAPRHNRTEGVDHFRNYTGRYLWDCERIAILEETEAFEVLLERSLKRRKVSPAKRAAMTRARSKVFRFSDRPGYDARREEIIRAAAACIQAIRDRGYYTPHIG